MNPTVVVMLSGTGFIVVTGIIYSWWVTRKDEKKKSESKVKA